MAADVAVVKEKVQTYLRELVGGFEVDKDGDYTFRHGSTRVFIDVDEWAGDHVAVAITAMVAADTPASPELFEYVATEGNAYRMGTLRAGKQEDGTVMTLLTHQLLGDFLDPDEFKLAVALLAEAADGADTEIVKRFGGRTFHEDEDEDGEDKAE